MKTSLRVLSQATLLAATGSLAAAGFTDLHPATGADTQNSFAYGISADGLTTIGYTNIGSTRAAYWAGGVRTDLSNLSGGTYSIASGASANGSIIIGEADDGSNIQAVRWVGGTIHNLGDLSSLVGGGSVNSTARAASANGGVIVGDSGDMAFKWTSAGMAIVDSSLDIGANPSLSSSATGVSANGTVIVGWVTDSNTSITSAFFSRSGVTTTLDPSGLYGSTIKALAVSGNGLVTVGYSDDNALYSPLAFKHTVAGGLVPLGHLGGFNSEAYAVNTDGSVIVGKSVDANSKIQAFKYQDGVMTGLGFFDATYSGRESTATGVSSDGSVIVGYGKLLVGGSTRTHAFVYANAVMLDADEWMRSINGANSVLSMSQNLGNVVLEGAHHRPLLSYDNMGKSGQSWVTGDFAASSRQSDSHATTGEVGFSNTFGNIVSGLSAGYGAQNQDLIYGGASHVSGHYLLAEADVRLSDKESILSAVVMLGQWQSDTQRGYATGSGTATSQGRTNIDTTSVRLRFDGPRLPLISSFAAAPFASVTWTRTAADAYAETGGSFPAAFNAQTQTTTEGRLGLATKFVLSPTTTCLLTAEWIHRFNGTTATLSGNDVLHGALPFSAAGVASTRNQARVGIDIDQKIDSRTLLNFSVHAAGFGQSPDIQGAISLRRAF